MPSSMNRRLDNFLTWFISNSGYIHEDFELVFCTERGTHVRRKTTSDPDKVIHNTVVLTCPHSLSLSAFGSHRTVASVPNSKRVSDTPGWTLLPSRVFEDDYNPRFITAVSLLVLRHLGQVSFWWPYIDLLPKAPSSISHTSDSGISNEEPILDVPLLWEDDEKELFRGTPLEAGIKKHEDAWYQEYNHWRPVLNELATSYGRRFTWQDYQWALSIIDSRSFSKDIIRDVVVVRHDGDEPSEACILDMCDPGSLLYPGIDFVNHCASTTNTWLRDQYGFSLVCNDKPRPGEELMNSYGTRDNAQLLLAYGFTITDSPHEAFPLTMTPAKELEPFAELLQPATICASTEMPSRILQAHDTAIRTFYIRLPARSNNQHAGYPLVADDTLSTYAFSGFPLALISRMSLLSRTQREKAEAKWTKEAMSKYREEIHKLPLCGMISLRLTVGVASLLLRRLGADFRGLQDADNRIMQHMRANTKAQSLVSSRLSRARSYTQSQIAVLNANIEILSKFLERLVKPDENFQQIQSHHYSDYLPTIVVVTLSRAVRSLPKRGIDAFIAAGRIIAPGPPLKAESGLGPLLKRLGEQKLDMWAIWIGLVDLLDPNPLHDWMSDLRKHYGLASPDCSCEQPGSATFDQFRNKVRRIADQVHQLDPELRELWASPRWMEVDFLAFCINAVQAEAVSVPFSRREDVLVMVIER